MTIKIFGESEPETQDIYLKLEPDGDDGINVDVVTKEGDWVRTLLYFTPKGLILCTGAEEAGFPVTKQGRIKVIKG